LDCLEKRQAHLLQELRELQTNTRYLNNDATRSLATSITHLETAFLWYRQAFEQFNASQ